MAEDEECIADDGPGQCATDLDECSTLLQILQDAAVRDEDIGSISIVPVWEDLIDGICSIRQNLCACLTIDDENECIGEGCRSDWAFSRRFRINSFTKWINYRA